MKTKITSKNNFKPYEYSYNYTEHSKKRTQQRGITDNVIMTALECSKAFFKQGLIFYVVIDKYISEKINPQLQDKLKNLVVVMAQDETKLITCYKSNNALKSIKQKSDSLM